MSETPQSEPNILSSQGSPGEFLRQEREHQGLTREEVGAALNLRPAVIEGLEDDTYDQVPVVTYRRGYLRSYAQLLGVDTRQVMELYQARMGNEEVERKVTPVYINKPPSRIGTWLFRLVTLIVIAGLVGLTLMWWQSRGGSQPPQVSDNGPVSVDSIDGSEATSDESPDNNSEALPPVPEDDSEMGLVADGDAAAEGSAASADAAATQDVTTTDDGTPVTVAAAEQAAATTENATDASAAEDAQAETDQPAVSEQAVASANELNITFNGASWVNINDSTNTQLLNGTQAAGTEVTLEGEPPIRLVIGNASEVALNWQGEAVDLRSIAGRSNVARFTLGE
ncbi:hypothetical protein HCU01_20890 [Halomonas cupida]|uniref:Cytoskeleton protein RodZ n=1 Tax=Halomonas cupida TaxID=44933 RepID=A0A1M7IPP3_9GAMM|nr:RodZ domain-containing protein [Halomonas cupida]GEN24140.1 hypothetical protein HCU01_20890 [Halomonas cupida]SHM42639.1 cytoskeleton protein RodZ [Halomonas cupida]